MNAARSADLNPSVPLSYFDLPEGEKTNSRIQCACSISYFTCITPETIQNMVVLGKVRIS